MLERDLANLEDAIFAIRRIEQYTTEISSADSLLQDSKTYDAVLLNFLVIAAAFSRLSPELKKRYPEVSWNGVRRFRNYIAHDYFGVDIEVVW